MWNLKIVFAVAAAAAVSSGCSGDGVTPPLPEEWVEAQLNTVGAPCTGQRAFVPKDGTALFAATPANTQASRTEQAGDYAAYRVSSNEVFAYFSFDPTLPRSGFTTDNLRRMLQYSFVSFSVKQPDRAGGSLTLLSSRDLLHLSDFERFEVQNGQLQWRLVRRSGEHYDKVLSIYDQDLTNDPSPPGSCFTGDIGGICHCDFTGPSIEVTIEGTTPLVP